MKKRVLLLCVLVLLPVFCFAEGAEDVVWGISRESFLEAMGEADLVQAAEDVPEDGASPAADILTYYGQRISRFEDASVSYYFSEGRLAGKMVHLGADADGSRFAYLSAALTRAYGESGLSAEAGNRVLEFYGLDMGESGVSFYMQEGFLIGWEAMDGTGILLFHYVGANGFTMIFYLAPADVPGEEAPEASGS